MWNVTLFKYIPTHGHPSRLVLRGWLPLLQSFLTQRKMWRQGSKVHKRCSKPTSLDRGICPYSWVNAWESQEDWLCWWHHSNNNTEQYGGKLQHKGEQIGYWKQFCSSCENVNGTGLHDNGHSKYIRLLIHTKNHCFFLKKKNKHYSVFFWRWNF